MKVLLRGECGCARESEVAGVHKACMGVRACMMHIMHRVMVRVNGGEQRLKTLFLSKFYARQCMGTVLGVGCKRWDLVAHWLRVKTRGWLYKDKTGGERRKGGSSTKHAYWWRACCPASSMLVWQSAQR